MDKKSKVAHTDTRIGNTKQLKDVKITLEKHTTIYNISNCSSKS